MSRINRTVSLAVIAAGLLAVGCGGGDGGDDVASVSGDGADEQAQDDQAATDEEVLDWVECMRDEGIDIPDPTRDRDGNLVLSGGFSAGGGADRIGDDGDEDSDGDNGPLEVDPEDMEAATAVCGDPPDLGAGDADRMDPQAQQDAALEFAQCMRDEGIEDFPDPDFSDQGPGGDAGGDDEGPGNDQGTDSGGRVLGPFGEIDMDDPEIAAAFEACQDLMMPDSGSQDGTDGSDGSSEGSGG
jgi:hypothetical protein